MATTRLNDATYFIQVRASMDDRQIKATNPHKYQRSLILFIQRRFLCCVLWFELDVSVSETVSELSKNPTKINKQKSIFDYTRDDFELVNYIHDSKIKAKVAVRAAQPREILTMMQDLSPFQ